MLGKAGKMESWQQVLTERHRGCQGPPGASPGRSCSPRCTWPSASGGTRTAEREGRVSPTHPPGWTCPFLPQSAPAPGCWSPFNSDRYSVHTPRTRIHRLTTSWLGKRPWGSSDTSSKFYPIHRATDHHPEFKPLLECLHGWGAHCFLKKSLGIQQCKVLDTFFSSESKTYYL